MNGRGEFLTRFGLQTREQLQRVKDENRQAAGYTACRMAGLRQSP